MQISYKKSYQKSFAKLDSIIKQKTLEKIELFLQNPHHPLLNTHFLKGKYKDFQSLNITWDYRAIFREVGKERYEFVEFLYIGTHSDLYR